MEQPLWQPSGERIQNANMTHFMKMVRERYGRTFADYAALHQWSIDEREKFWDTLWDFCGVIGEKGARLVADGDKMPGARFFPDGKINLAENLLRRRDTGDALVFWGEDKVKRRMSRAELYDAVSRLAQALAKEGLKPGDRVGGFLPNLPETLIAMLAVTSLGAVWSSCSPDFGVKGVVDRFGQIEPEILFVADGYHYNGKQHDSLERAAGIVAALPKLKRVIVIPYTQDNPSLAGFDSRARGYADYVKPYKAGDIAFTRMPFNAPLYVMYSSGTTGVPKCIAHGIGGTLLKHLSEEALHGDIKADDRVFFFTTCGWMMWNWLMTNLACGATLLLFDGAPTYPSANIIFDYADAEKMTHLGTSAKFIDSIAKMGLEPKKTHKLETVRIIFSTGSPLAPQSFDYIYEKVKSDVSLASMSGGTDLIGSFVGGNPMGPVWRGEIQCSLLGMAVAAFDEDGRPVIAEKGELVCTKPFPSMPIGFWNDPGDKKYFETYFAAYPNIWCHGDYIEITKHGGVIIYGRSDAVLNPGGVRIGTAEIYRQVEQLNEVESLVVGQDWQNDVRVVLFVRLREGVKLDQALTDRIRKQIRDNTTPRHVPAKVIAVADIPRTISGKIVELAVRNVIHDRPVKNQDALANPDALKLFAHLPELAD